MREASGEVMSPSAGLTTVRPFVIPYSARLTLANYSVIHALVDATTAGLVLSLAGLPGFTLFAAILTYNIAAFGTQFLLGLAVDGARSARGGAALGCAVAGLAAMMPGANPYAVALVAGLGNSLFHVGGGSVCLNISPGRATAPGIFVAPGALGLFLGVTLARRGLYDPSIFAALMFISALAILLQQGPEISYERRKATASPEVRETVLILLLVTVLVRALVGMTVSLPWKSDLHLAGVLTACVVAGKGLGGVLADRFGWRRVALTGLLLSAPLLTFLGDVAFLGMAGAFLFQMTMAVTLTAVACLFPGRSAFAFGLPCLALIIGALPAFSGYKSVVGSDWILFGVIIISAWLLNLGLRMFFAHELSSEEKGEGADVPAPSGL